MVPSNGRTIRLVGVLEGGTFVRVPPGAGTMVGFGSGNPPGGVRTVINGEFWADPVVVIQNVRTPARTSPSAANQGARLPSACPLDQRAPTPSTYQFVMIGASDRERGIRLGLKNYLLEPLKPR
jgi:hypothetical protein